MRRIIASVVALFVTLSLHAQIFVANAYNGTVGEYSFNGSVINASLISGFGDPSGIASDENGHLFVTDLARGTVGEYTTAGVTVNSDLITGLGNPEAIAVANGYLYVATSTPQTDGAWPYSHIAKYTTSGTLVSSFLSFIGPTSMASDGRGNFFIASTGSSANPFGYVDEFTASGNLTGRDLIYGFQKVSQVALAENGNLYVTSENFGNVAEYSTSGALINGNLISGLSDPFAITTDGNGHLLVGNFSNGTIGEYTLSGTPINSRLITGLSGPWSIVVVPEPQFGIFACGMAGLYWNI